MSGLEPLLAVAGAALGSSATPAVAGAIAPAALAGANAGLLGTATVGGLPLSGLLGTAGGVAGAGLGSLIPTNGGDTGGLPQPIAPPTLPQGPPPQPRTSLQGRQLTVVPRQPPAQIGGLPPTLEELLRGGRRF